MFTASPLQLGAPCQAIINPVGGKKKLRPKRSLLVDPTSRQLPGHTPDYTGLIFQTSPVCAPTPIGKATVFTTHAAPNRKIVALPFLCSGPKRNLSCFYPRELPENHIAYLESLRTTFP
ncbi:MAG: hypothetical protein JL50_04090 [Peptococcaceae bacterium BICA1-7]|nr:MAG: hypothetical protein JL50_04090 [Peptococcaceae bacterium BICA1-7]HBV97556.1 hypothetical protein [Desulfotomaculum sp.]